MSRKASIERITKETQIRLTLNIDGKGEAKVYTSVPFLDHMLDLFTRHGLFDLQVEAKGDIDIDTLNGIWSEECVNDALLDAGLAG